MTKIEIKNTEIEKYGIVGGEAALVGTHHYGEIMIQCLKSTSGKGFFENEIDERLRVIGILKDKEVGDVFEIEDHDAKVLQKCVEDFNGRWPIVHEDTSKFMKYIRGLGPVGTERKKEEL